VEGPVVGGGEERILEWLFSLFFFSRSSNLFSGPSPLFSVMVKPVQTAADEHIFSTSFINLC
jgi:hypothetical protein